MPTVLKKIEYLTDDKVLVEVIRVEDNGDTLVRNVSDNGDQVGTITAKQRARWHKVERDGAD